MTTFQKILAEHQRRHYLARRVGAVILKPVGELRKGQTVYLYAGRSIVEARVRGVCLKARGYWVAVGQAVRACPLEKLYARPETIAALALAR